MLAKKSCVQALQRRANEWIRRSVGLNETPPPRCDSPELAYSAVDGVARVVNGDLAPMLIGGVASLFFQMLHPRAMAGVADHSRYRDDPLGRMRQTATFIGVTTYGTQVEAARAIERVRAVHEGVRGTTSDGQEYYAGDSALLEFVHCTETSMFLRAYQIFGATKLSPEEANSYVDEMSVVARDLGVVNPPRSVKELDAALERFRPELRLSEPGRLARDFIVHDVVQDRVAKIGFRAIVRAAFELLPPWARRDIGAPRETFFTQLWWKLCARALSRVLQLAVPPAPRYVASESPPSTATT